MEQDVGTLAGPVASSPAMARAVDAALTAASVLAATLGFLCGASAGRASGATRTWLLAAGAALAGAGVVAGAWQRWREAARLRSARQVAEDAQVDFALT